MLNRELKRNKGTCIHDSIDIFEKKVNVCRNPAQVSTLLRTAGSILIIKGKIVSLRGIIARRNSVQPNLKFAMLKS